jgi:hypothetical protein
MGEYSTAQLVEFLRRKLTDTAAPVGKHWGVIITTETCKAVADRLEELQAHLTAYEDTRLTPEQARNAASEKYEQIIQILVDTVPQLVQAIVARLPQLVEAAVNNAVEELQEG